MSLPTISGELPGKLWKVRSGSVYIYNEKSGGLLPPFSVWDAERFFIKKFITMMNKILNSWNNMDNT